MLLIQISSIRALTEARKSQWIGKWLLIRRTTLGAQLRAKVALKTRELARSTLVLTSFILSSRTLFNASVVAQVETFAKLRVMSATLTPTKIATALFAVALTLDDDPLLLGDDLINRIVFISDNFNRELIIDVRTFAGVLESALDQHIE